jgi:hypothetical protein
MISLLAIAALIQEPAKSPPLSPMFGGCVFGVGDVDGDKVPDFLIGDEGWTASAIPAAFWILSGADAHEIHAFHAEVSAFEFPRLVFPAGDVDTDGRADLWLVLPPKSVALGARIALWSGKSKTIVREADSKERRAVLAFGERKRPFGDFDGDGTADELVIGDTMTSIRSGKDDSVLWSGGNAEQILLMEDVDHDGARDLLRTDPARNIANVVVQLLSSRTNRAIWKLELAGDWSSAGPTSVIGDLDGDRASEWIIGGANHNSHEPGATEIRSGKTGALLASFTRDGCAVEVSGSLFAAKREH